MLRTSLYPSGNSPIILVSSAGGTFDFGMGIGMLSAGFIATHTNLATAYGVGAVCCLLSLFVYIRLVKASYERNKLIS